MFETPTWRISRRQGWEGARHSTSIFIHHTSGKEPGHPRGLGVCELPRLELREHFSLQSLDGGWIIKRGRKKSLRRIKHTSQTLENTHSQEALGPRLPCWPWATKLLYKHLLTDTYSHMKATHGSGSHTPGLLASADQRKERKVKEHLFLRQRRL